MVLIKELSTMFPKRFLILASFSAVLLFSNVSIAQHKQTSQLFEMLNKAYETADYKLGLNRIRDLSTQLEKREGSSSIYAAELRAWEALFNVSLSKYDKYSSAQAKSIAVLNTLKKGDESNQTILVLAKSYMAYGDFLNAEKWLSKSDLDKKDTVSLNLKLTWIQCEVKRGFYNKSQEELKGAIALLETYGDEYNNLKAAFILNYIAVLIENGETQKAKVQLDSSEKWIFDSFRIKNGYTSEFFYLKGLLAGKQQGYDNADRYFQKAVNTGRKFLKPNAPFFEKVQEHRISNLMKLNKLEEADYWQNDQDVAVVSYYGKKSTSYRNHKLRGIENIMKAGLWKKALSASSRYISEKEYFPKEHFCRLKINKLLYEIYLENNKITEAKEILKENQILALKMYGEQAPVYHFLLLDGAEFKLNCTNDFKNLNEVYELSLLGIIKKEVSPFYPVFGKYNYDYVRFNATVEKYSKAREIISTYLSDIEVDSVDLSYNEGLLLQGEVLTEVGSYDHALRSITAVIRNLKGDTEDSKMLLSKAYRSKAQLQLSMGNWIGSSESFSKSIALFHDNIFNQKSVPIEELAELSINLGKYRKTERELLAELEFRKNGVGDKHWSNVVLHNSLAKLYIVTGDFVKAEKNLIISSEILKKVFGEESLKYAHVLSLFKQLYTATGDYDKAENFINRSLNILEAKMGFDNILVAVPMSELALAKLYNSSTISSSTKRECLSLLKDSKTIIQRKLGKETAVYATALENSGISYLFMKEMNKANSSILEALLIWKKVLGQKNVKVAKLTFIKGNIAYRSTKYKEALDNYNTSKEVYRELFGDLHPNYLESLGMSARMYYILGEKKEAITFSKEMVSRSLKYMYTIFPNLSERGKSQYWNKVKEHFEFYNSLVFTNYNEYPEMVGEVFNINLQTKSILLDASVKIKNRILSSNDTILISAYDDWVISKENLIAAISMTETQRKDEGLDLKKIEIEIETIERFLRQRSNSFDDLKMKSNGFKWRDLRSVLKDDEQVIELISFRFFTHQFSDTTWYVTLGVNSDTKGNPSFYINKNGDELNHKAISFYRNSMRFNTKDEESYNVFWKPLETLIEKSGRVYISLDGVYNKLNLESIRLPEGGFVIDKYNINLIGTSRDLLNRKKIAANERITEKTAFFLGSPKFYSDSFKESKNWKDLPGTKEEINYLSNYLQKNHWTTEVVMDNKATETAVKSVHNPVVFHLATHGIYEEKKKVTELDGIIEKADENPLLRSGLMLANGGGIHQTSRVFEYNKKDGILTAYEAMNLDLEKTDLVVLSACETGLGEIEVGEGVWGLRRAFAIAGAKTIIISLFEVSDEVTTELMNSFYSKWIQSGDKRKAFIDANKQLMLKYDNSMYWGAFLMQGLG